MFITHILLHNDESTWLLSGRDSDIQHVDFYVLFIVLLFCICMVKLHSQVFMYRISMHEKKRTLLISMDLIQSEWILFTENTLGFCIL